MVVSDSVTPVLGVEYAGCNDARNVIATLTTQPSEEAAMAVAKLSPRDRFMQYVSPEPNSGCWLWTGATSGHKIPRGKFSLLINGRWATVQAYRFSYEQFVGLIPPKKHLCHKCDTPLCVNPDHLFVGSSQDNVYDFIQKHSGTSRSSIGLPFGVGINTKGKGYVGYAARLKRQNIGFHLGTYKTPGEAAAVAKEANDIYRAAGTKEAALIALEDFACELRGKLGL